MPSSAWRFDCPAAEMVRAAVLQLMLACLPAFTTYRPRSGWIRHRSGGRGGIGFRRGGIFRIAIANPGFALDRLYAFCKSCKRAVRGAAGEICAPRIILRVSDGQSKPDNNRDRDYQSPRHPGLPASRDDLTLRILSRWLNCADGTQDDANL